MFRVRHNPAAALSAKPAPSCVCVSSNHISLDNSVRKPTDCMRP